MKTTDDQLLGRWLDGELPEEERLRFEARLATDATLRAEADRMQSLRGLLRDHVALEREVPHADFFNAQIQERIAQLQDAEDHARARPATSWFGWLRSPWTVAGALSVLALGYFLNAPAKPQTEILSFYAPIAGVQARAYHDAEAGATVLLLDGIGAIPADKEVAGINVNHSANDPAYATTTLFDDAGRVLLVMTKDGRNQPMMLGGN